MVEMVRFRCGEGRRFEKSKLSIQWYGCQIVERL